MEIASKWAVRQEHAVNDGEVTDAAVAGWVDEACRAYLERCSRLRATADASDVELRWHAGELPSPAAFGRPQTVAVSATAPEFRPRSFTIAVRLRPSGGDVDRPFNVRCGVTLEDRATGEPRELCEEIRDELIAIEQSARHVN
jgi:hypothetical protein